MSMYIDQIELGNNIYHAIKNIGMTETRLADELDVGIVSVCRWVNGHSKPTLTNLLKISLITHTSVDTLVNGVIRHDNAI